MIIPVSYTHLDVYKRQEYEGKSGQIDLISYENQQFQWAAEDLIAGDISAVSEGNGVLTVFDKSNSLKVGDTIQLEQTELTVAGVLKDSPFDTSDQPTVICSEKTFKEITGKDAYAVLDVQLSQKATEQNVNELHVLANGHYLSLIHIWQMNLRKIWKVLILR